MSSKALGLLVLPLVLVACESNATAPENSHAAEGSALRAQPAAQGSLTRITSPSAELPGPPFYARTAPPPNPIYIVDGWAVFQFYRDPACIRPDFNLLEFFDAPAAFGCTLLVKGFALQEPGFVVPKVVREEGIGPVPYWFVPADAVLAAIQDGVLTIGELAALPGRLVGYATTFNEMQHASAPPELFGGGGHRNPMLSQSALGTLGDGRSFEYHLTEIGVAVKSIELRIE